MDSVLHVLKECSLLAWEKGKPSLEVAFSSPTMLAPLSGRMRMQDGKRTVWLGPEQIVLLRPGHSVTICADKNESPPVCRLSFESYRLAEHDDEQLVYRNDRSCLPASGWVRNRLPYRANVLLNELLHACQQASAHGQTAEQKQHQRLFKELMELALQYEITPELDWEPSIQKAITYIEENYRSPITRSELARLAGFHTSYFSTLFAKKLGWGYSEYLNRVRIDRAKEHLLTSAMTVNEIAAKVGYANGEYLSRKFKQLTGMSPGEFRSRPIPKRIAAFQFVGDLLALGVTPVATDDELVRGALLLKEELQNVPTVNGAYDDEQLANLKADLVLAPTYFYYTPGRMKRLQNIAPVLALEWDKLDPLAELRLVGKLIGREREAERWIERYQAQVETARKQLQKLIDRGDTAAVYELRHDGVFIWNKTARGAYNLYDALGFRPPESVHRDVLVPGRHLWIAADRLPEYAADHMFVIDARDDHGAGVHGLSLPAFEKAPGQVYALELNEFWSSDGLALERQLHIQTNCLLRGGAE
ncbi:helix-turn-helix domain-containing protein [Brevibacillus agri]|uniref:helix-turn-helix domain-containing protein n=1 Tax=Brevibacillus agri TaxID=51101 RepID=UPI0030F43C62